MYIEIEGCAYTQAMEIKSTFRRVEVDYMGSGETREPILCRVRILGADSYTVSEFDKTHRFAHIFVTYGDGQESCVLDYDKYISIRIY